MTTTTTAPTTRTVTVSKRDGSTVSVESPYSDTDVLQRLWKHTGYELEAYGAHAAIRWTGTLRSSFARDLAVRAETHRGLSAKQLAWVHVLVVQHEQPRPTLEDGPDLSRVRDMMDRASESLKYPKVTLTTESGQTVRLSRAGLKSATPGVVNITDGRPYGDNTFFGRISRDGVLRAHRNATPEVLELLVAFNEDPEALATAYGRRTGSCCFCSRTLTDSRSVSVGYGPVCADRYELVWGESA